MDVSIVLPIYRPDPALLTKIRSAIKSQKRDGKLEVIEVDEGLGLADSLNFGIRKAKYPIVVSLHQDCIPQGDQWLETLISPLLQKEVVASVSQVNLPKPLWDTFDAVAKVLSVKEQNVLTPLMDEKGCAYKKEAFLKGGFFDGKTYRTAGEDFDMYLKLSQQGKIAYPEARITHYHSFTRATRLKKELQLSNAFGTLVRIHKRKLPGWYIGLAKSIPLLGYPLFFKGLSIKKLKWLILLAIPLMLLVNFIYAYGFWKGFLMKRQTV